MKNKRLKMTISLLMLLVMIVAITLPTMAFTPPVIQPSDPGSAGDDIKNAGSKIAGLISVIAAAVAISILIWLAIKYMSAAPSDKADIKKSAVTYVIGAVLLFAASGVLGIIASFGQGLFGGGGDGVDTVSGAGSITEIIIEEKRA